MINKVFIATFSLRSNGKRSAINGMVEPLLSFFLPKTESLILLDTTHPGSDTVTSFVEIYRNKKLIKSKKTFASLTLSPILALQNNPTQTQLIFKIRDLLDVMETGISMKGKADLFIGLESIFTLGGILLKKLGKAKTVVYYVSDYSPNRYSSKLMTSIYLWLDRFCCYNADYIWDVSPAMMPARIKAGIDESKCAPLILVPNGLFKDQISYLPKEKMEANSLVFLGTLGPENGPQVAIDAMKNIEKQIPNSRLHIIGGGDEIEKKLKEKVNKLGLNKNIIFHGFISNAVEVSKLAQNFMIGLAPYTKMPDSPRWFADATKIRLYMGIGLPTITTSVPPLGKDVSQKGSAIIVEDDPKDLARVAIELLKDKKNYDQMRKAAIDYAKNNTWENSYGSALKKMNLF